MESTRFQESKAAFAENPGKPTAGKKSEAIECVMLIILA